MQPSAVTPAKPPLTTIETVVVGAALGVLSGFVHAFNLGAPWPALLQALIGIAATYGVNVIVGPAFRNLFNLPPAVLVLISFAMTTVMVTVPYWNISGTLGGLIQGALAFLLALGLGTAVTQAMLDRVRA